MNADILNIQPDKSDATTEEIKQVKVDLYVESMSFKYKTGGLLACTPRLRAAAIPASALLTRCSSDCQRSIASDFGRAQDLGDRLLSSSGSLANARRRSA